MTAETKRIKPAPYYEKILCFDISSIINRTGVLHRHFSSHTRPANMSCEATFKKTINKETKNAAWRQFKATFLHSSHLKNVSFTFYLSCCTPNYWVISVFGITLDQAWATSGPRATCDPPSTLMWPASYVWSFLTSNVDIEHILIIQKISAL